MKKGFTLVELIASLAIFSLAMVAISMAFFASFNTRQMNDVKQSTAGYAQAIIETFRGSTNTVYDVENSIEISKFVYFNNMSDFNIWYKSHTSETTEISGIVNESTYPLLAGNQFGALIKIKKEGVGNTYHIYVRVWKLSKGAKSQSVRDIYESRTPL